MSRAFPPIVPVSCQVLEQRLAGLADGCGFQDSMIADSRSAFLHRDNWPALKVSCLGQKWRTAPGLRIAMHLKIA